MNNDQPTKEELVQCLVRSGYLLESRLVRELSSAGFFVEPNQVVRDRYTGKSREIDLLAEYYSYDPAREDVCVKSHFIIEAINNLYPFVLATPRPNTPNLPFEEYLKFITTPDGAPFSYEIDLLEAKDALGPTLYSQYCAFKRKKSGGELMALHTDDVHNAITKMIQYADENVALWSDREDDDYWRVFFWQPILVLQNNLMVMVTKEDGTINLLDVPLAKLEFNYHDGDRQCSAIVDVVVEKHLLEHMKTVVAQDDAIQKQMAELRGKERN